jgi:hypothetical protein
MFSIAAEKPPLCKLLIRWLEAIYFLDDAQIFLNRCVSTLMWMLRLAWL